MCVHVCGCGMCVTGACSHVEHSLFRSCHFQSSLVTGDGLRYLSCRCVWEGEGCVCVRGEGVTGVRDG